MELKKSHPKTYKALLERAGVEEGGDVEAAFKKLHEEVLALKSNSKASPKQQAHIDAINNSGLLPAGVEFRIQGGGGTRSKDQQLKEYLEGDSPISGYGSKKGKHQSDDAVDMVAYKNGKALTGRKGATKADREENKKYLKLIKDHKKKHGISFSDIEGDQGHTDTTGTDAFNKSLEKEVPKREGTILGTGRVDELGLQSPNIQRGAAEAELEGLEGPPVESTVELENEFSGIRTTPEESEEIMVKATNEIWHREFNIEEERAEELMKKNVEEGPDNGFNAE